MDLVVGRVVKAHGVTGELAVEIRTDDPDNRFVPGATLRGRAPRGGPETEYVVESVREHGGRLLLRWTVSATVTPLTGCAARYSWSIRRTCLPSMNPTSSTTTSSRA